MNFKCHQKKKEQINNSIHQPVSWFLRPLEWPQKPPAKLPWAPHDPRVPWGPSTATLWSWDCSSTARRKVKDALPKPAGCSAVAGQAPWQLEVASDGRIKDVVWNGRGGNILRWGGSPASKPSGVLACTLVARVRI